MAGRKKHQEESFENAEGFQIEDLEGNAVVEDEIIDEDAIIETAIQDPALADEPLRQGHERFWEDDEDDETEEDEYFNSVAENNDWEEGYDY
jgi:hypothetical protein